MMQANTGVRFETKDPLLSQLVKQAEEKCRPAHGRRNVCQP